MTEDKPGIIPQIKRSAKTDTGKLLLYLNNHPTDVGITELVINTLKVSWLPLSMEDSDCSSSELRKIALWSISHLENQINIIRRICLNSEPIQSFNANSINNYSNSVSNDVRNSSLLIKSPPINSNEAAQFDSEEDDDDDDEITDLSSESPNL